ncbi:ATP-binding protein [Streptomyces sp. NPDC002463]|uniref:ATP-binding protein n=1 Tax=Streptomyces sp. NPDC002463 TaxID=3364645 RepID=UPI0036910FE8
MNDVDRSGCRVGSRLIGRERDLAYIRSHFDHSGRGAALLLSGEAGLGKTAVLEAVAAEFRHEGAQVLRASGVQYEADISYAGLNQLLVPFFDSFGFLEPDHRDALRVAVGIGDGPPPNQLLVSTALLFLLRRIAREKPLLITVDDLPWLDRATTSVLAFVARRLTGSDISFLAATRVPSDDSFALGDLSEHRLQPLDDVASGELIRSAHPDVPLLLRRRIVAEAHGNPLALVELPTALKSRQEAGASLPSVLPLTERLQKLFASRVADLPLASREVLLVAALEGTGDLGVIEAATGSSPVVDALEPAERDRLLTLSTTARRMSFRHPLIGSAVVTGATAAERRRAHEKLADALTHQLERRAWHLGEATTQPTGTVADLLEQAAHLRSRRGDALGAVAALTRAAELSPVPADKSRRLAEAAYLGAEATGELADASRLLAGAQQADPAAESSLHAAAASALLLINQDGDVSTAHRVLLDAIEGGEHGWDASDETLLEALFTLNLLCWYSGDPEKWPPLFRAIDRLAPAPPDLLWVCAQTFADPARTGTRALSRLDELLSDIGEDPARIVRLGHCAVYPDRLADLREPSMRLVESGRAGTAPLRRYLAALLHVCLADYDAGKWDHVLTLADEGIRLCEENGYRFLTRKFQYPLALVAAARGDTEASAVLTEEIVGWATPRGADGVRALACHIRGLTALGSGDFESAYLHSTTLTPVGSLPPYQPQAMASAVDVVEAAVRTGRVAEAAAHTAALRASTMAELSPRLSMLVLACEALITTDESCLPLFEEALSQVDDGQWPFDTARVRLFYGERLRRHRLTSQARGQLAEAARVFDQLGAAPWKTRVTAELRASGHVSMAAARPTKGPLTAQEREIATLAATGLTNKQIAERLFLSHRTIGTHLYQIYPKLGINSRAALRDALAALDVEDIG